MAATSYVTVRNVSQTLILVGSKYLFPGQSREKVPVHLYYSALSRYPGQVIAVDQSGKELALPESPAKKAEGFERIEPDDLTRIKGIGPKRAEDFRRIGLDSYQKLAQVTDFTEAAEQVNVTAEQVAEYVEQAQALLGDK